MREYIPILPSLAYEIDLMLSDAAQSIAINVLMEKIEAYLETEPKNRYEKAMFKRMQNVHSKLDELKEKIWLEDDDREKLAKSVNTDRYGWQLKGKRHIY